MNNRICKWKAGDILKIKGKKGYELCVVRGLIDFDSSRVSAPDYLVQPFGRIKGLRVDLQKFIGYHTKAYKEKMRNSIPEVDGRRWLEGMDFHYDIEKLTSLKPLEQKAYNAMMQDYTIHYDMYNHIQIKYIFEGK